MLPRFLLVVGLSCAILGLPGRGQAEPDPIALLRGIESVREPWRGTLFIKSTIEGIKPKKTKPREVTMEITFDRDKRRIIGEEIHFELSPSKEGKKPTPFEKLKAVGGDTDRGVELGIGKYVKIRTRTAFDGTANYSYDEHGSAVIRDPKKSTTGYCFDARILGLVGNPHSKHTLKSVLAYQTAKAVRLVGKEVIRGASTWHVVVEPPFDGVSYHFWVEDREGYRVHRFEHVEQKTPGVPNENEDEVDRSDLFYQDGNPIPIRIELNRLGKNKHTRVTDVIEIAEIGPKPDPAVFGLAGLDIVPGEMISDNRIHETVGYWDGTGITKDHSQAIKKAAATAAETVSGGRTWPYYLIGLVVVMLGVLVWYRRKRQLTVTT